MTKVSVDVASCRSMPYHTTATELVPPAGTQSSADSGRMPIHETSSNSEQLLCDESTAHDGDSSVHLQQHALA
jgi:hypothetical protein